MRGGHSDLPFGRIFLGRFSRSDRACPLDRAGIILRPGSMRTKGGIRSRTCFVRNVDFGMRFALLRKQCVRRRCQVGYVKKRNGVIPLRLLRFERLRCRRILEHERGALVPDPGAINSQEYARDIAARPPAEDHNRGEAAIRYDRAFFRSALRIESWSHYDCVFIIPDYRQNAIDRFLRDFLVVAGYDLIRRWWNRAVSSSGKLYEALDSICRKEWTLRLVLKFFVLKFKRCNDEFHRDKSWSNRRDDDF